MAKINRTFQKIFANAVASSAIGQIGSLKAGTKVLTSDLSTIQSLSAFANGFADIIKTDSLLLSEEELNALFYLITSQLAYIFQDGIPAYDSSTTYFETSIVRQPNTTILYKSKTNNNVGNLLSDINNWQSMGDLSILADIDLDTLANTNLSNITPNAKDVIVSNCIPDYTKGVTKTTGVFTPTQSGRLIGYNTGTLNASQSVSVYLGSSTSGTLLALASAYVNSSDYAFLSFDVLKGQTYYLSKSCTYMNLTFYPFIGEEE